MSRAHNDREPTPALEPGQRIESRYEILAELGRGGMTVVYEVFDHSRGERVALKRLRAPADPASAWRHSATRAWLRVS